MKKLLLLLLVPSFLLLSCKKDKENTNPVSDLSWSQQERDTILSGDTTLALRIYLTTNLLDSMVLRSMCFNVFPDTNDVVLMTLISRMQKAMIAVGGVGIAAPQVGIRRNICWVKRQDKPGRPNEVYLNPKITMTSVLKIGFIGDGCLSVPGISGKTDRFRAVGIEYDKIDGTHVSEVVDGYTSSQFTAICFQHEIDHLSGILFVDRIIQ